MLKLRRNNKINDFYFKTQPDEHLSNSSYRCDSLDPQQSLFQISLKANQLQYARTFTCWNRQIAKNQTINVISPVNFQEGCFNKTLANLQINTGKLNKKEFQLKKWKEKKYRESELKKSIISNQKKKSCIPINLNLQNYDRKKYSTRIHSRAYSTSFYNQTSNEGQRSKSQICCDLEEPRNQEHRKGRQELILTQKQSKKAQDQLVIYKKRAKTLRQTSDSDQQSSFRQPSFTKYFNILNTLLCQQKKRVLFPLKRLCTTAKLKGIFQKRRHSVSK